MYADKTLLRIAAVTLAALALVFFVLSGIGSLDYTGKTILVLAGCGWSP